MQTQPLFITMVLHNWDSSVKKATATFNSFTDEELLQPVAPGRNRIIYLLGHLTAVHDMLLPLLGLGERKYPQLHELFISNADDTTIVLPSAGELRAGWAEINKILHQHFQQLTPEEWFQQHTMVSAEDFAKEPHRNRLNVLMSRINHLAYHQGQLALVKK